MSLSLKQYKNLETKVNDKLYDSIKLLTHIYPTTKEFDEVFKKNMFVKSNKSAFQHVIYYLFTILNPELTKQRITWPLYEVKLEPIFRNEVVAFINDINAKYEHANIPNLMASHFVSPGGMKIAQFMLKLSMVVIVEHLKRHEDSNTELLYPIKAHKDRRVTNLVVNDLKSRTALIEAENSQTWDEFSKRFEETAKKAEGVVATQEELKRKLSSLMSKISNKKSQTVELKSVEALTDQINELKKKYVSIENIKDFCHKGEQLLATLQERPVLEFKKDDFIDCESILSSCENNALDLTRLFNSLSNILECASLQIPVIGESQLNSAIKSMTELQDKILLLENNLSLQQSELFDLVKNFSSVEVKN